MNIDKGSSLLTGRPPTLNYRYTRFSWPFDLSEEVLIQGGEALQQAIDALDENGWNTEGEIYSSTATRAHGTLSPLLNEVLELSLGDPAGCTGEQIKSVFSILVFISVLTSSIDTLWIAYSRFTLHGPPPCISDLRSCLLRTVPTTVSTFLDFSYPSNHGTNSSITVFWRRLCLRLITLEHRLLLERLAHKQGALDGQSMVDCAREMLELTVLLWVQRDRFVEHHHDYDWMLMCWGVPSSGVLCVELLKQMKQPPGTPPSLRLPRSEIVQNLSLLIGFLEWVKPAAGNYQLCVRMRIIIKRILDQILNPSPPSSAPPASQESLEMAGQNLEPANGNGVAVPFDWNIEMGNYDDGVDNLDWLNNVDWSRGPWFDLGQDFSAARWG